MQSASFESFYPFPNNKVARVLFFIAGVWILQAILRKITSIERAKRLVSHLPGNSIIWLHPFRSAAPVLAPFFPFASRIGDYYANYAVYEKFGSTCLGSVLFWGSVPVIWLSDSLGLKTVSMNRTVFRRDLDGYEVVSVYGPNMVATEGTDWKRHRNVSKPAFNEANNVLVWHHATRVVNDWCDHLQKHGKLKGPVKVDLLKDMTEVALLILSSAAFGRHNTWTDHSAEETSTVHKIPFRPAVTTAVDNLVFKVLTPDWMFTLAKYGLLPYVGRILRETNDGYDALRLHMLDLIATARAWVSGGKGSSMDAALLQNLVQANIEQEENSSETRRLTDQELLSNIFMFLLAGHETSAHSLCFAICLLALYPDVQQKMYEEVARIWPDGAPSTEDSNASSYRDTMSQMKYTTAVFRETLRVFPPVPRVTAPVRTATSIQAHKFSRSSSGKTTNIEQISVAVPEGSMIVIDIIALHRNPVDWGDDADEFKPERFIDTDSYKWPRDAFLAFSAGPRSCMGEGFAMTESVCILAQLVRKYKIELPEHIRRLPRPKQKEILSKWVPRMTLIPSNASVVFEPRN